MLYYIYTMPRAPKNDVNKGLYLTQVGTYADNSPVQGGSMEQGGSFKSFFRKLGKTVKGVASDIGNTALSAATDVAKQGVTTAIQNPDLVATALSGTGLHDRLFDKELDRELNKHEKSGGSLSGGSLKSIARQAFQKSKRAASKEINKQINNIKAKVQPDIDNIKSQVSKKVTDFTDDKYNQLKGKINKTLGTTDIPSQAEQTASGVSGGKKKRVLSDRMRKRNELVKQLMKKHNIKMTEASKMIKQKGLM
jgi:hypothetical protein